MCLRLIYVANNFTADAKLFGLLVGDDALGGGKHGDSESVEDARHALYISVLAQTRS